jgi:hypothetical protein
METSQVKKFFSYLRRHCGNIYSGIDVVNPLEVHNYIEFEADSNDSRTQLELFQEWFSLTPRRLNLVSLRGKYLQLSFTDGLTFLMEIVGELNPVESLTGGMSIKGTPTPPLNVFGAFVLSIFKSLEDSEIYLSGVITSPYIDDSNALDNLLTCHNSGDTRNLVEVLLDPKVLTFLGGPVLSECLYNQELKITAKLSDLNKAELVELYQDLLDETFCRMGNVYTPLIYGRSKTELGEDVKSSYINGELIYYIGEPCPVS